MGNTLRGIAMKKNVNEYKEKVKTVINEIATKEKIPDLILYTTAIGILYFCISYVLTISPIPGYLFILPIYGLYKKYHAINV